MSGGLYDWRLCPIGSGAPFPDCRQHPLIGQVLCTADEPSCREIARVWVIGPGTAVRLISPRVLAELVAALDHGMPIAVLGDDADRVRIACSTILQLAGEHHA